MLNLKKRIAAYICAAAVVVTSVPAASPITAEAKVLAGLSDLGCKVAAEGGVLLENNDNVLPFAEGTTVSVFGRAQCHYDKYKSGLGSGGEVKVDKKDVVGIVDGLRNNSKVKVNEDLAKIYSDWVAEHPYVGSSTWSKHPWSQEEMPMTEDIAGKAAKNSDAAVIVIARTAGEDRDAAFEKGSYLLTDAEENMMRIVSEKFEKVVVVLNVTAIIDMNWVDKYHIDSVLYSWNGGQNGGKAVADLLTGDANPSGRLTDTIATDYTKYPTYKNYGSSNGDKYVKNLYQEDIYVGYRYFETFAPEDVAYPFGYGLSYTKFDIKTDYITVEAENVKVTVTVTNIGDCAGKEVVQVYYGAPQAPKSKLGNPVKELAAFAKTETLSPGETQHLTLSFKLREMASYDDSGVTGHESAYVLEAGDYKVYVGNNVREAADTGFIYTQDQTEVVEQLSEAAAPIVDFERYKAVESDGKIKLEKEKVPKLSVDVKKKIENAIPQELRKKDNNKYKLIDVYNNHVTMEEFVAQMSNEELAALTQGCKFDAANNVTDGCAGAFGGVEVKNNGKMTNMGALYGIPLVSVADGPSGVRVSETATLLPCGNAIGCTWNTKLVEDMFEMEGEENLLNHIDSLLGPGINIRRDPRCGRNFEYYSEDPLLSGMMAAATAKGVQKTGATVTAKHFAANNQEASRRHIDAVVSERALREIYLRCFEIYVKDGKGRSIMTAYNPINGCWAPSNYDLNTEILRKEWGYEGIVMTDWWGHMSKYAWADASIIEDRGDRYTATMVKAQNDIYMPVDRDGGIYNDKGNMNGKSKNIMENIENGYLKRAELQRTAVNICNFVIKSQQFATYNKIDFKPYVEEGEDWFTVEKPNLGNPQVTGITVDGRKITTFNPQVSEYRIYLPKDAALPTVEATAENGTTIRVEQAANDSRSMVVWATESQATRAYRIIFTDAKNVKPILENPTLAKLSDIRVNGKSINGFQADTYSYSVAAESLDTTPDIVPVGVEGVTASVQYDANTRIATIECVSKDQAINYELHFGIEPKSDEFDGSSLSNFWSVNAENKDNWGFEDGHLVIKAERGSIWQNQSDLKNQFIQDAYGDWEVVVKVEMNQIPWKNYQSFGIVAMQDTDNYIYSKMEHGNNGVEISYNQEKSGSISSIEKLSAENIAKFGNVIYFKMKKLGNTYIASVSPDGENYIRYNKTAYAEYEAPKFALINGNGDQNLDEVLEAKFDYVHFETENLADTVNIGASTKLKVAEVNPTIMNGTLNQENCRDEDGGFNLTDCERGEYITYDINVEKTGLYNITARMASPESDTQQVNFIVSSDNEILFDFFTNGTGGAQTWTSLQGNGIKLTAGKHKLKIDFNTAGINLNWLQIDLVEEMEDPNVPTTPDDPTTPVNPTTPTDPTGSGEPTVPSEGTAPSESIEPGEETVPSVPIEPSEETVPSEPITPDIPTEPSSPTNPGTPTAPDAPANPSVPAEPGVSTNPGQNDGFTGAINQVQVIVDRTLLYVGGNTDNAASVKVNNLSGVTHQSVTYESSNGNVASVDNTGNVKAIEAGETIITTKVVLSNGELKVFTEKVTVKKAFIKKTKVPSKIKKGKKVTLKAKVYGSSKPITWQIKKGSKFAKLTKKGKFTAKAKGTVKVVAQSGKLKKAFTIKVK